LGKGDIASIGQGGDNESTTVSYILVVIPCKPIANLDCANSLFKSSELLLFVNIELELRLPLEMLLVSNLSGDKHIDNISLMDINSNNGNDLNTKLIIKMNSDSLNQVIDSLLSDNSVVFHSILTTTIHVIELPDSLFSPNNLCTKK